jgi:hypothetical protein
LIEIKNIPTTTKLDDFFILDAKYSASTSRFFRLTLASRLRSNTSAVGTSDFTVGEVSFDKDLLVFVGVTESH